MIQSLDLNNTQVSDLAPLAGLTRARAIPSSRNRPRKRLEESADRTLRARPVRPPEFAKISSQIRSEDLWLLITSCATPRHKPFRSR